MRKYGLKAFQGKSSKFHTYKGDNGNNKENLLLDSIVNSNTNKIQYTRNFSTDKPNQNGLQTYQSLEFQVIKYIYLQY